jgi:hypothetical protein
MMTPLSEELLNVDLTLPEGEKSELAEALTVSHSHPRGLPFDAASLSEVQRQSLEVEQALVVTTTWPEVRDRARRRLREENRCQSEQSRASMV